MDFRYKFSNESKNDFLAFLKVAKEHRDNVYCDSDKYEEYKTLFPLDSNIKNELNESINKQNITIDIIDSDEGTPEELLSQELLKLATQSNVNDTENNDSPVDDIIYAIKESIDVDRCLTPFVLNDLLNCSHDKLVNTFDILSKEFNLEAVVNLGLALNSVETTGNLVTSCYTKLLLLNKLKIEYSDKLQEVFNEYFCKYSTNTASELSCLLLNTNDNESKILLQYVDKLNCDCKSMLFRELIFNCNQLHSNYIPIIEILLNNKTDFDSLNKLTEIMSNAVNDYTTDKNFGKLLMNVIQVLGKNLLHLEKPLKHIIGSHSSIWKTKIQKMFNSSLEDSMIMSQSFRAN